MRARFVFATSLSILALGCTPAPEPPPEVDLEAARAALLEADEAWFEAYSASDSPAEAFAANVTPDAYLLPPDAPMVRGRDAIQSTIAELAAIPGFEVTWGPVAAQVGSAGDLGYTIGTYEMKMAPEGAPIVIAGKYLTVWQKRTDGSWSVTADMFNADGPPEVVEPAVTGE